MSSPLRHTPALLSAISLGLLLAQAAAAKDLALLPPYGEHMVLQRDRPAVLQGEADAAQTVTVQWGGKRVTVKADASGRWSATLPARGAGGPHALEVQAGKSKLKLSDVWVGDVWLCAGQSNMEWPLKFTDGADEEIRSADAPSIRHMRVPLTANVAPQSILPAAPWVVGRAGQTGNFSAIGWYFARTLQAHQASHKQPVVPIGLLDVSWGGSHIETWFSRATALAREDLAGVVRALPASNANYASDKNAVVEKRVSAWQPNLDFKASDDPKMAEPGYDHSRWPTLKAPEVWESQGLADLDGVVWYRREITLTAAQAQGAATLSLGNIDDCDDSYVNGQRVGGFCQHDRARRHPVPAGLLKEGRNVIAVRVTDYGGGGGFYGDPALMRLETTAGHVALSGTWAARVVQAKLATQPSANDAPTLAFNAMVEPLRGLPVAGVIWYQGESNVGRAERYREDFPTLVREWRAHFAQAEMPFLWVQLAAFLPMADNNVNDAPWAELRDAQTATLSLPNTGMAIATDLGNANDIHPRNKRAVGERLARWLTDPANASGPRFVKATPKGKELVLDFDRRDLQVHGASLNGFALAQGDGPFKPAQARLENGRVIVWHPELTAPDAVRFGWVNNPSESNLYDGSGLPARPFRTDARPLVTKGNRYQ